MPSYSNTFRILHLLDLIKNQLWPNFFSRWPNHYKHGSLTLDKSNHKVLGFHYTIDNNSKLKDHGANYGSVKLELQRVDWHKVFYNHGSFECCEKFKEIIDNLISKFVPLQKQTCSKKKNLYGWTNNVIKSQNDSISSWKRKTNTITKCMLNIEINWKVLGEKRFQIMKNHCWKWWIPTQKHLSDMQKISWIWRQW